MSVPLVVDPRSRERMRVVNKPQDNSDAIFAIVGGIGICWHNAGWNGEVWYPAKTWVLLAKEGCDASFCS